MKKRVPTKYLCEIPGVKRMPDGREICLSNTAGDREYEERTSTMASRQWNRCAICGNHMIRASFDHQQSRGGGKRDDRIVVDGRWHNAAVCLPCNGEKGSRPYEWVYEGRLVPQYLPVNRTQQVA